MFGASVPFPYPTFRTFSVPNNKMFSSVLQVGSLFSVPGDAALKIGNRVFKLLRRSGPGVGIPWTRNHPPFRHKSLEGSIRTGTGYRPKQSSPRFAASPQSLQLLPFPLIAAISPWRVRKFAGHVLSGSAICNREFVPFTLEDRPEKMAGRPRTGGERRTRLV